ncbi:MAG: WbqC family protein [Muribaculaceae bacterium]|nr:WbqC family protein [Muribaculaceae bacterium]
MEPNPQGCQSRQQMVSFPPYLPASIWYAEWLRALVGKATEADAIIRANETMGNTRDFARTLITETGGRDLMLTVAVEGGGRQLRNAGKIESIMLSEHGNWRKNHSSAIEAAYGKYPYYQYYAPELKEIYSDLSIGSLKELNQRFHLIVVKLLAGNLDINEFKLLEKNSIIIERGKELAREINPEISIISSLMKYGPETITGIFALRNNSRQ